MKELEDLVGRLKPDLSDDALVKDMTLDWADWRGHVPILVRQLWPNLTRRERQVVYLTALTTSGWEEDYVKEQQG